MQLCLKKLRPGGRRNKPQQVFQTDTGYRVLHPTKGFRHQSAKRLHLYGSRSFRAEDFASRQQMLSHGVFHFSGVGR